MSRRTMRWRSAIRFIGGFYFAEARRFHEIIPIIMDAPTLADRPVADCTSEEVANALNRGFEGYFGPLIFTAQAYERRCRSDHLDPYASRVYSQAAPRAGPRLMCARGWTSRVAAD